MSWFMIASRRCGLFSVLWLLMCATASAAPRVDERALSKSLKDRAVDALARHDYATARQLFEEAYALYPSPNLLFDLGVVLVTLGDEPAAANAFSRFSAEAIDHTASADRYAQQQLERLTPRVGRLAIACNVDDAEVSVDGVVVDRTPLPRVIWAAAGLHRVEVRKPGYGSSSAQLELAGGAVSSQTFALEASVPSRGTPQAALVETPPARRRPVYRRAWLWGTVAGGAVLVGTAIALGVVFGGARYPDPTAGHVNGN